MHYTRELMHLELIGLASVENVLILGTSYFSNYAARRNDYLSSPFFKRNQEILLDLVDFALQKHSEDNLMVAISWAWV